MMMSDDDGDCSINGFRLVPLLYMRHRKSTHPILKMSSMNEPKTVQQVYKKGIVIGLTTIALISFAFLLLLLLLVWTRYSEDERALQQNQRPHPSSACCRG